MPCRSCSSCSCFPTSMSSPVPPSQTLGVLFFPLSPPSRKGVTHNQRVTSILSSPPRRSYHSSCAEASQLLLANQSVLLSASQSHLSQKAKGPRFLSPSPHLSLQTLILPLLGFPPPFLTFLILFLI
jgi:hypothetical protein